MRRNEDMRVDSWLWRGVEWEDIPRIFADWVEDLRARWQWLRPGHVVHALWRIALVQAAFIRDPKGRQSGDGRPIVARVRIPLSEFGAPQLTLEVDDVTGVRRYQFREGRWRPQISRHHLEHSTQAWPGYIDGVEAAFSAMDNSVDLYQEGFNRLLKRVRKEVHLALRSIREYGRMEMEMADRIRRQGRHKYLERWRRSGRRPDAAAPEELAGIPHVKRLEPVQPCHVYFLVKEGHVVYVGKTASAWPQRIETHAKDDGKDFDDVWYVEVDHHSLNRVEAHYIRELDPPLNAHVPTEVTA